MLLINGIYAAIFAAQTYKEIYYKFSSEKNVNSEKNYQTDLTDASHLRDLEINDLKASMQTLFDNCCVRKD